MYLPEAIFSHDQFHFVMSRIRSFKNLKVKTVPKSSSIKTNVAYKEVLKKRKT